MVQTALNKYPEIDEFIIYVGSGERDGISQDEAILVWDIFANYLPMKVQIEPSNGPIGDIIRLGKNNPEDEIYFVIGGRDGNEDDMKDIASRTKNIEAAYPNIKVKVITTPDGGMSGTNARKAAKKSEEELSKYLPKALSPEEKLEIFNIIRPVIKENLNEGRYDQEILMQSRYMINQFKNSFGEEYEDSVEGNFPGLFDSKGEPFYYDLDYKFIPSDINVLGPLPYIIEANGGKNGIEIVIQYDPSSFPGAYNELIAEIKDSLRHELEHVSQFNLNKGFDMENINQDDLPFAEYLTLDYEIPAFIQGLYKRAKTKKIPLSKAINDFFDDYSAELSDDEEKYVRKEWGKWIKANLNVIKENIEKDVIDSFDIQDTLVKDVWDDNKLKPEIREKLLKIAQDFFDSLELPEDTILRDIKLTGSLANFNWSKFSDVDLHLVLDFSEIADNEEFARDYFMAKKNLWNNAHDVDIFGYPVEVYVEDKDEPHTASGLYSILNDKWITVPQQQKIVIDKDDISSKAEGYLSTIPQLEKMFEKGEYKELIDKIDQIKERIRDMRSSGLEKGGLYSVENLAFKVLRRSDFVEQLNTLKTNSYDAMMSLNEDISKSQLDSIEGYADKLFAKLGIDIEFTRHFLDRLNDKRNNKPISVAELVGIFKRLHRKHGKPLSKIDNDFDAVVKDFNNNINIPFAINVTPEDIDLVAKTIMRKKDFKTSTPVISLNENATYSQTIDVKEKIASLTDHMIEKGYNIEPLPNVEFIDGDSENASNFLGKTAYYDPDSKTIALYTEGRHPKDITRSYAHELIHHIQNLEGRLGDIKTTNTLEDDALNDLEAEANLKGTMTFRNWTDSLNEDKDYFGLNKAIKEIIEEPKYKIFSDMDGVLTDFDRAFKKVSKGIPPREYEKKFGKDKFWELIDGGGVDYWVEMPYMSDGKQYWDYIKDYNTELLSSPSRSSTSRLGKRQWVKNNMPGVKLTLAQSYLKRNYAAPNHILIDDRKSNIEEWRANGGIGVLHTSAADTISQLKKLGL